MKNLFLLLLFVPVIVFSQTNITHDSLMAQVAKIKERSTVNADNQAVLNIIEALGNESLQSDSGALSDATINAYKKMLHDPTTPNWHLLYLYQAYSDNIIKPVPDTAFQAACIHVLFEEFIATYETAPAIILIFMGETLMGQNNKTVAAEHFKISLKYYPESVPLQVYRWQLTDDSAEKELLYKKLKKEHPNHWMVQMMLK